MLGICFFVLVFVSAVSGTAAGRLAELSCAIVDGAGQAVTLTLSLCGMMALWCGVMNVWKEAGMIRGLSRILAPVLRLAFPDAWRTGIGREEITAAVTANLLGIGNAATPLALSAMAKMQEGNPTPDTARDDMVTLSVLACSPFSLLPTTLIALRRAAGSAEPYGILVPVWITSAVCAVTAVLLCRLWAWARHPRRKGGSA